MNSINLHKTFNCGQCFRWKKISEDGYIGVVGEQIVYVDNNTDFEMLEDKIKYYFATDIRYEIDIENLDDFAKKAYEFGKGIRILRQDPWETLVTFIISQRNNIPRIATSIERLCNKFGKPLAFFHDNQQFVMHTFPTPFDIFNAGIDGLKDVGLGYRDKYVVSAATSVVDLDALKTCDSDYVISQLLKFYGVGIKVAECVALFGIGKLDRFPVDVWIERAINQHYNGTIDPKKYGKHAGLIQQYMFYYMKNV